LFPKILIQNEIQIWESHNDKRCSPFQIMSPSIFIPIFRAWEYHFRNKISSPDLNSNFHNSISRSGLPSPFQSYPSLLVGPTRQCLFPIVPLSSCRSHTSMSLIQACLSTASPTLRPTHQPLSLSSSHRTHLLVSLLSSLAVHCAMVFSPRSNTIAAPGLKPHAARPSCTPSLPALVEPQ
jgi:hypothetical protein